MARTSKKKIALLDEGIPLTDNVDSIDFAGTGVTGSVLDNNVTEDIPERSNFNIAYSWFLT